MRSVRRGTMCNDMVVAIRRIPFDGPVYNLSVAEDESYVLNHIVTHNCMCYLVPEHMTREEFEDRLARWRAGEPWPEMESYLLGLGLGRPAELPALPPQPPFGPDDSKWLWWLLLLILAEAYRRWIEADERETDDALEWDREEE